MQFHKLLLSLALISTMLSAKVHFDVAILRGTNLSVQNAVTLVLGEKPVRAYQDDTTYVEVELLEEAQDMPRVKLTVSTKNEHGMFLVRGMPQVTSNIVQGLGMSSIQCNSQNENFLLLVAMAKA